MPWLLEKKFWPTVSRIDDGESPLIPILGRANADCIFNVTAYGDTHLIVSPPAKAPNDQY